MCVLRSEKIMRYEYEERKNSWRSQDVDMVYPYIHNN
jgi:hypothetical protein